MPEQFKIIHADIRDFLADTPDRHFDMVFADAPYGLSITRRRQGTPDWDSSAIAFDPALWRELRRVTKPGATLLAFGHSRTFHRQTTAAEDAGWQIQDHLSWLKSHSYQAGNRWLDSELLKAGADELSEEYAGWGTHLRSSYEPVLLARNLASGASLTAAIANGGAGGLYLDALRIDAGAEDRARRPGRVTEDAAWSVKRPTTKSKPHPAGRLPGNLIFEHAAECAPEACDITCADSHIDTRTRTKYAAARNAHLDSSLRFGIRHGRRLARDPGCMLPLSLKRFWGGCVS